MPHKDIFREKTKISRETFELYELWHKHLLKWNSRINLVGKSTLPEFWFRHALDSWQITPYVDERDRVFLDFGSGGGFPGIALGIHLRNLANAKVTLAESAGKKASFLRSVTRDLNLPIHVHGGRIEDLKPFKVDVVSARAFAPLPRLFGYAEPFLSENTKLLLLKGEAVDEEIESANEAWTFEHETIESLSNEAGCLLIVKALKRR